MFARATANLTIAQFSWLRLSTDQLTSLMELLCTDRLASLRELGIAGSDVSGVRCLLFAEAISSLERVDLSCSHLTRMEGYNCLFKQMLVKSNLKELDLGHEDFTDGCGSKLFAKATNTLEILRLHGASFTAQQAKHFFKRMHEETWLKELHIQDSFYDPSLIHSKVFAGGLSKLKKIELNWSLQTETELILELLKRVSKQGEGSVVTEIDFGGMDLTELPADLLAATVNKMERAVLWHCTLTEEQTIGIFTAAASGSSSKYLDLRLWGFHPYLVSKSILNFLFFTSSSTVFVGVC